MISNRMIELISKSFILPYANVLVRFNRLSSASSHASLHKGVLWMWKHKTVSLSPIHKYTSPFSFYLNPNDKRKTSAGYCSEVVIHSRDLFHLERQLNPLLNLKLVTTPNHISSQINFAYTNRKWLPMWCPFSYKCEGLV